MVHHLRAFVAEPLVALAELAELRRIQHPRLDAFDGEQGDQPDDRAHLQLEVLAAVNTVSIGEVQAVVIEAVLFVPE